MRFVLLFLVIAVIIACLNLTEAEPEEKDGVYLVTDKESSLLDVDAGDEHGNKSPRLARGYYGHRHRGYGGYGGYYGGRRHYGGYGRRGYGRYYG